MRFVIMTSNLGVESYKENAFGFGELDSAELLRGISNGRCSDLFVQSLLGRIDRIVPFRPLPPDVVRKIAARETELLKNRPGLKYRDAKWTHTCGNRLAQ